MEKFERFSEEKLTALRALYRGDDLFRTWTWLLCLLEQQLNGLNAVEVWSETEMIRQKLSEIKEHRDNEVELKNRHQSEKTAVIILTVLFTQMCDAESSEGDDAAVQNPNRAVCSVLAHLLMNPKIRSFTEKLIKAFKHRRYDNEGNKIVLPITDYMEVKSPLELMDEEAKVKVERWVEEIEKLTRGIRGFLNIDWTAYDTIWRNICAEQEISLLLNEIQPRGNKWGYNLKLVANVLGILHTIPYGENVVLEGSIQAISDAVGVNVRAYIGNHADFGSSNTTLTKEMHAKIKQFILSAVG